jgi:CBS domain containing-hemolysin-like protein
MMNAALFWFLLNILSILVLAFYSMSEMACVSFNKIRLQYYVFQNNKRAIWLSWLLQKPSRLFCTTLIGVNVATIFGSEFAREFYSHLGLDPDLSSVTQILLVVIFGELAPMFAARRFAEHVALLGVPIVYASAKVMTPLIGLISYLSQLFSKLIGGKETHGNIFITQEELLKILEAQEEERPSGEGEEFNAVTTNILNLRQYDVMQVMGNLSNLLKVSSNATIADAARLINHNHQASDYILIYHREHSNIVAIAQIHDLIKIPENRRVRDYAKPPWFVTENTSLIKILQQMRHHSEELAIIIDSHGNAIGAVHLDDIIEEIFGQSLLTRTDQQKNQLFLKRKFPGSMTVGEFAEQFDIILDARQNLTLSKLITEKLGHHPEMGESIYIDPFELRVEEVSLLDIKEVFIRTP